MDSPQSKRGFTIIELITVMAVILILAALIATLSPLLFNQSGRSRAAVEMKAFSSAIQTYRIEQSTVPRGPASDALDPAEPDPAAYSAASRELYIALSGDTNADGVHSEEKSYFPFRPSQLMPDSGNGPITGIADPFGNNYGYSTLRIRQIEDQGGAPHDLYDLWSTGGAKTSAEKGKWIGP